MWRSSIPNGSPAAGVVSAIKEAQSSLRLRALAIENTIWRRLALRYESYARKEAIFNSDWHRQLLTLYYLVLYLKREALMIIFKHRSFQRWAKTEKIKDDALKKAVHELGKGLHDGNLGGGLYKKRVAMPGHGKRGSYRTLLAFKHDERAFFVYGFAKNVMANVSEKEAELYKKLAKELLSLEEKMLDIMIEIGSLIEVK